MEHERKWARWGLKGKLIRLILIVGALPLTIGMALAYVQATRELQQLSGTSFAGIATETARKLDLIFTEEIERSAQVVSDPLVIEALEKRHHLLINQDNDQIGDLLEEEEKRWEGRDPTLIRTLTEGKLSDILRRYFAEQQGSRGQLVLIGPAAPTRAFFLTDSKGRLVASINQDVPYSNAREAWWQGAYNLGRGRPYFENVYFDERLGIYAFSLSVPVMDKIRSQTVGVLHRVFDAKEYLDPAISPIRFGRTGHVMLIDSQGTVMSCPILPTGSRLADQELIRFVTRPQGGWVKAPSDGHGSRTTSIIGFSPLFVTSDVPQKSIEKTWYTFVWQSSDELFAPMQNLFKRIILLGLLGIGLLGTLGYIAAARVLKPIRRLQEGAIQIGRGELQEPITVGTGDEIEQLADEFNRMNIQLQKAFSSLEHKVEEQSQEVRYLQEYNEQILMSLPTPIIILDHSERVEYLNRAATQAFNLPNGDIKEINLFDLIQTDEPSRQRLEAELKTYPKKWNDKNEIPFCTQQPSNEAKDPLVPHQSFDQDYAYRQLKIASKTYHYNWFRISAQLTEKERIGLVLRDTTEESLLQDRLTQAEMLAGLSVLSSGIGHELNNPLFGIMGLAELIPEERDAVVMKEHAEGILKKAKQMARIIQDFAFSANPEEIALSSDVDINQQLDRALKMAGLIGSGEDLEVEKNYQSLPRIKVNPEEIVQAFVNIIENAIQAMKGRGTLHLATEAGQGKVTVRFRDSGPGIPRAFVPKVFDPFFTTKRQGQGRGLGLTIVHRIVKKYGGQIVVETEEGRGTTFILDFPG